MGGWWVQAWKKNAPPPRGVQHLNYGPLSDTQDCRGATSEVRVSFFSVLLVIDEGGGVDSSTADIPDDASYCQPHETL